MLQNFTANRQFVNFWIPLIVTIVTTMRAVCIVFVQTVSIQNLKRCSRCHKGLTREAYCAQRSVSEERLGLSPICFCGCGQEVGQCESLILYHMDLFICVNLVFSVSRVTIFSKDILASSYFYSSLDTCINTNTHRPKCGAPTQAEYTSRQKEERKKCIVGLINARVWGD